jgi:integrase
MASVFKAKGAKRYTILYYDENGKRRKKKGATDKAVSQRIANELENRVALRVEGLIDPAAERFAESERKPIAKHLDDFIADLEAKKRDPKHVRTTRTYIQRIIDQAHAERLSDLTLSTVQLAIGAIQREQGQKKQGEKDEDEKEQGLSARAANAHATAIKSFLRWATKDNRIRAHELGGIAKQNEKEDRRYIRRPLSEANLRTLISTTRTAPEWRGISGEDRSIFYLLGAVTGFRRTEMSTLTPEDFDLDGPRPVVCLDASRTKNGDDAEQPLLVTVATELKSWLASKPHRSPVFALPEKTAEMLHADLRRCGIEPVDAKGRVVDTHSLRHGYISALARAGVPLKVAQTLARHSDPKLTMNVYAHLSAFDLHGAVADALPDLTTAVPDQILAATGTDGPTATENATGLDGDERNPLSLKVVTSNRTLTLNQRVVGSSPTGGILTLSDERT